MESDDSRTAMLRLRHRLAENLAIAVAACLLLAAAGGFVAYEELTAPDTRTEERTVATWTTDSQFVHQATVERGTRAFDEGTVLDNRSAYLLGITPELTGTHVYSHRGDAGPATVSTTVTLVTESVGSTESGQVTYWRVTEPLGEQQTTLQPGERARATFTVDVPAVQNESRQIESELGGTPGQVQIYALVTTRVESTLDGEPVSDRRTERLTIQPGGTTYAVTANTTGERSRQVTEPVAVPIESNPARRYGGALFALLSLGLAGALVLADRRGGLAVSDAERKAVRTQRARERFDEWISRGIVPDPAEGTEIVRVASLEDLVDVAIDSDRRVLEDTPTGRFVTIVGRTRYVYEPATDDEDSTDDASAAERDGAPKRVVGPFDDTTGSEAREAGGDAPEE